MRQLIRKSMLGIAAILTCIFLVFVAEYQMDRGTGSNDISMLSPEFEKEKFDRFRIYEASLVEHNGDSLSFALSAARIVHRKRASKFFVYQNLKEIYLHNVQIETYPLAASAPSINDSNISLPVDGIADTVASLVPSTTKAEDYLAGRSDIDSDMLSRLLLADMTMTVHLPGSRQIVISAEKAYILTGHQNMVLEGNVRIVDGLGNKVMTSVAVWSNRFKGFYLPEKYTLQNKQLPANAFYVLNLKGALEIVSPAPSISDYADALALQEEEVYERLSKRLPVYARHMLGLTPIGFTNEKSAKISTSLQ